MVFLVIDDSSTQRKIIIQALKEIGFAEVIEAENGLSGYTVIKEKHVDFVLTDWNMPVLNGVEFSILVKGQDKYKQIPIIMISSQGNTEDVITAIRLKVNNYIVKPFTADVLEHKIKEVLSAIAKEKTVHV